MEQSQKDIRARPATLWTIIKGLQQKPYDKLLAWLKESERNAKFVSLIRFYRSQADYDREAELKLFDQATLKKIKHRGLELTIAFLAEAGQFSNEPIQKLLAEIQTLMDLGAYHEALGWISDAITECERVEAIYDYRKLLALQLSCVTRCMHGDELIARLGEIRLATQYINEMMADLERFENLALKFQWPLRAMSQGKKDNPNLIKEYQLELEAIDPASCKTSRSLIQYHKHWLTVLTYSYSTHEMSEHIWNLQRIFELNPALLQEDPGQFGQILLRVLTEVIRHNDLFATNVLMERICDLEKNNDHGTNYTLHSIILAYYIASWRGKLTEYGNRASTLFIKHKTALKNQLRTTAYAWILFWYCIQKFQVDDLDACQTGIDERLKIKVKSEIPQHAHLKVLRLFVLYYQGVSHKKLGISCEAVFSFLKTNHPDLVVLKEIVLGIKRLATSRLSNNNIETAWQTTLQELQRLEKIIEHKTQFELFDYCNYWKERRLQLCLGDNAGIG